MKPYAFDPNKRNETGCCPGHDWPRTRRWSGTYNSAASKRASSKSNKLAKRIRRKNDKLNLYKELRDD